MKAPPRRVASRGAVRWPLVALIAGGALVAWLLTRADLGEVSGAVAAFGVAGLALVLLVYLGEYLADVALWHASFRECPAGPRWFARLFGVRLVGEALNLLTPLGGVGGEPVKALILKRRYGLGMQDTIASLVAAKTALVVSLLVFLAAGYLLVVGDARFTAEHKWTAGVGLAALALGIFGFWAVQRFGLASRLAEALRRRRLWAPLVRSLDSVAAFDRSLRAYYVDHPRRFSLAIGFGLVNWGFAVLGVWLTLTLMEVPVTFAEAVVIESVHQLLRAGVFFIPGAVGVQEGAFALALAVLRGAPDVGLAVSLVRRARDAVWAAAGLAAGWRYAAGDARAATAQK